MHVLRDRHSLAADLRDLEREQAALTKRVSKLRIQDVLPFRVAALQKSMVNQTPLALTVMAPKRSAPVPLKVYQASFVVKVRVVPAQPSAAPLPCPSFPCAPARQCGQQRSRAKLQPCKQQSSTTSSVAVRCCAWMVCTEMMVLTTPTTFRLPTPVSLAPRGAWARSRRRRSPSSPLPPWRRRRCGRPARGR